MATYFITDTPDVTFTDDRQYKYKYRYKSSRGFPVAQDEMMRRREQGIAGTLWRWENFTPTMMEQI